LLFLKKHKSDPGQSTQKELSICWAAPDKVAAPALQDEPTLGNILAATPIPVIYKKSDRLQCNKSIFLSLLLGFILQENTPYTQKWLGKFVT
jgi:hypothetical protein